MNILHNSFLRKIGVSDFILNLSPSARRAYAVGAIGTVVVGTMYYFVTNSENGPQILTAQDVKQTVLFPIDTRTMGMDSLAAKIAELERAIDTRDHRIQALSQEIDSINRKRGNDPGVETEIEHIKGSVAALTNKAKELGWDVEEIRDVITSPAPATSNVPPADAAAPKPQDPALAQNQLPASNATEPPVVGPTATGIKKVEGKGFVFDSPTAAGTPEGPNPFDPDAGSDNSEQTGSVMPSIAPAANPTPVVIRTITGKQTDPTESELPPVYLPAGSIISGVLLNGLDAPTSANARKNPAPVLVRIQDDAILPNLYSADIKECFILLSGVGDMSSERAHLRSETMSCITESGDVIEQAVAGYAVGSDGKEGIRGRPVHRAGALLANTALAGFAGGVAQAFGGAPVPVIQTGDVDSTQMFQDTVSSDSLNYGVAQGGGEAMNRLAKFYLDQAEQIFPIIEIDGMRPVDIMLTAGVKLEPKKQG